MSSLSTSHRWFIRDESPVNRQPTLALCMDWTPEPVWVGAMKAYAQCKKLTGHEGPHVAQTDNGVAYQW